MTREQLLELAGTVAGRPVLSIFMDGAERDPASRNAWRLRLERNLDRLEAAHPDSLDDLKAARRRVEQELGSYRGFLPGAGWAAFATADALAFCGEVPARTPDVVRWGARPLLGPLLGAVSAAQPIAVAVLDRRRARLLEYAGGALAERVDLRADDFIDDLTDRNMSKRASLRSGVRGETATDAAEQLLKRAADALLAAVLQRLEESGAQLVIAGGPVESSAALRRRLEQKPGVLVDVVPELHVLMSDDQLRSGIAEAARRLIGRLHHQLVEDVVSRAGGGGQGALGSIPCRVALVLGQVERLLLTPHFVSEYEVDAEELIDLALNHGSEVHIIAGEAATLLDAQSEGVGARLRYVRRAAVSAT